MAGPQTCPGVLNLFSEQCKCGMDGPDCVYCTGQIARIWCVHTAQLSVQCSPVIASHSVHVSVHNVCTQSTVYYSIYWTLLYHSSPVWCICHFQAFLMLNKWPTAHCTQPHTLHTGHRGFSQSVVIHQFNNHFLSTFPRQLFTGSQTCPVCCDCKRK